MQPDELKQLIETQLNGCEVHVESDGSHFSIVVIGDLFAGLRPVKKQQLVYACLNDLIASGAIHAVNIKTYTPAEWQSR